MSKEKAITKPMNKYNKNREIRIRERERKKLFIHSTFHFSRTTQCTRHYNTYTHAFKDLRHLRMYNHPTIRLFFFSFGSNVTLTMLCDFPKETHSHILFWFRFRCVSLRIFQNFHFKNTRYSYSPHVHCDSYTFSVKKVSRKKADSRRVEAFFLFVFS